MPVLDLDNYAPALLTFLANKLTVGGNALYRERFGVGITDWRGMVRVKLDGSDARRRPVALTASGRRLHDRIIKLALAREAQLLECLSAAERRTLLRLLNRLHANLATVNP